MLCTHCFREINTDGPCPHCGFDGREQESRYPLALRPGSILNGRYTVGRVLGQGGFGITYIALDDRTGSRVAIKEYLPTEFAGRAGGSSMVQVYSGERRDNFAYGMERFLDEARTLAEFIGDAHIVRIYSYFEENATAYFVMEYVDGTPLNKYMESVGGRLSVEDAAALLLPLMDSLGHVHAKGVVHRDIAPDNVLIEHGRSAKIIDFGAARYSTGEKSKSLDVILKHGFAPMEQYTRRGRQGPFTDVYAMAATFYFAITGRVPPEPIDRLYDDPLAAPSALGVKISDAAEAVLFKALEVPAQQRYQSMAEFHRDMEAALTADRLGREQREREARREQERLDREQKGREQRAEAERLQQEQRAEAERLRQEQKAEAERLRREEKERAAREKAERKTRAQAERAARKTAAARTASEPPAPQHKKKSGLPLILGAAALVVAALVFVFARGGRPASPALPEPSAAAGAEASVSEAVSAAEEATEEAAAAVSGPYRPGAELLLAGTDLHGPCEVDDWTDVVKVFSAGGFTLGVRRDGTALATGANMYGQCNVSDWTDLTDITGGWAHTLGLRSDGTVVATGNNVYGQCNVSDWSDIVAVAAGGWFSLGLRADGTVVSTGDLLIMGWRNIKAIAAGNNFFLALDNNGTVYAGGSNELNQLDADGWQDIVAIDARGWHAVGLRRDGTVIAAGATGGNRRDVESWRGITAVSAGYYSTVGQRADGSLIATGWNYFGEDELDDWHDIVQFSAGEFCTVGLRADGTVIARGQEANDFSEAEAWTGLRQIAAGENFLVGLKEDGTLVTAGSNVNKQREISGWKDIRAIAAGTFHTVGLTEQGTVLTQGRQSYLMNQSAGNWRNIVAVAAGTDFTVGLRDDGTVVAAGVNDTGQCNVGSWRDITAVAAGPFHTLGLRSDGTVVATGESQRGECAVQDWRDIVAIAAGEYFSAGLRSDGTVVTAGANIFGECDVQDWTEIRAIAAGHHHLVGLREDGTLVAAGLNFDGECNLAGWDDVAEISAAGYITAARRDLPGSEDNAPADSPAADAPTDALTFSATSGDDMYDLLRDTFYQSGGTFIADDGRLFVANEGRDYVFCMTGLNLQDSYTVNKSGRENTLEYGWSVRFDNGKQRFEVTTVSWRFHPGQPEQRTLDEMDHCLYRADGMAEGTRFEYVLTPGSVSMSHTDSCIFWIFTLPESVDFDMANVHSFTCTVNADDESESWTTPAIGH